MASGDKHDTEERPSYKTLCEMEVISNIFGYSKGNVHGDWRVVEEKNKKHQL